MKHWIFSYGSLAHKQVAEKTGKTLGHVPAVLKGYIRNFRTQDLKHGFSAAGIERSDSSETFGMLVAVPEEDLPKYDEREYKYDRVELDRELLLSISEQPLPEGKVYLYVPKQPGEATEEIPLAQTYLDVILSAYLELDEKLAEKVLESTLDLDRPWLNDRMSPRYPRHRDDLDTERIDTFLKLRIPEKFDKRVMESEVMIKPELVSSILAAVSFFDLFDFPLTAEEVMDYLYKYERPLHIKELRATLNHLVQTGKLSELKGHYVLPGREGTIETRKARKFIAEKFWNRTKLYGTYMRRVPFVKMIAVCNNLAYDNPSSESDIDLFIVVRPGRMWLARLIITIILQFYGVRRHGDKIAGRFCLSFFVTTDRLSMRSFELDNEDPYLAYWTKNLKPIFGEETYRAFQTENEGWLAAYGMRFTDGYRKHMYHDERSRLKGFFEWLLGGFLGDFLEGILKLTLKKKSLKSMKKLGDEANVVVSDEVLKFHNIDRRRQFRDSMRFGL